MIGEFLMHLPKESWVHHAVCPEVDPEIFFPEKGTVANQARLICGRCPVDAECLEYALKHRIREGVWGGLTERQRRELLVPRGPRTHCDRGHELAEVGRRADGRCVECHNMWRRSA